MFEEFYEMYESEEQEVVALINRCIGGGFNWKGNFWEMTVVTLGIVSCDTGKVSTKEERLDWPVTDEERHSDKGWGRFQNEQICRLKIRRMKEEWAKDLVVQPWCISEVVKAHEDCPELQAVLDEYHKPVVIQDQVLGELTLDKDYDTFEGEIQWCGKDVSLSLEVNAESKPSWTRARSAAKKLLSLMAAMDNYSDYLLLWSPRDKKLWYLDIEHEEFHPLAKWDDFIADPGRYLNGMIEGEFEE